MSNPSKTQINSLASRNISARAGLILIRGKPSLQIGLLLVLGFALYLNILHAPFIFDDRPCIIDNPMIRDFTAFLDPTKIQNLALADDIKKSLLLRPMAYLTFALNYRLGGLEVFGFHLVNIAIHLVNAVLIFLLARVTLERAPLPEPEPGRPRVAALIPFLVALLFVAHPLQISAVTYITQRFTSLTTLFYLASLLFYIRARTTGNLTKQGIAYGLSLLLAILAMKTKSIAFTLPAMLLLYDLFFLEGRLRQRLLWLTPFFLTLLIIPGTILWLLAGEGRDDPRSGFEQAINLMNFRDTSSWTYLKTQFGVITTYLRLLLWPSGLNLDHDYPLAGNFFALKTAAPFFFLLSLLVGAISLAIRSFRRQERSTRRLVAFGILWFFVTIAMSSSFIPLDDPLVEYRIYLPSFGFFFTLSVGVVLAVERGLVPCRLFLGATTIIVVLLATATVSRNHLFRDKIELLSDIVAKSPNKLRARAGLGEAYLDANQSDAAIREYRTVLQALPNTIPVMINLGIALMDQGKIDEGIKLFQDIIRLDPQSAHAYGNLGYAYLLKDRQVEAEKAFLTALIINKHLDPARESLARLYEKQGRRTEALEQYRQLLQFSPGHQAARIRLRQLGVLND